MHLDDEVCTSGNTESQSPPLTLADLVRDEGIHRRLHRIAESRARLPRGSQDAQDLVADVIADLATGAITPDPPTLRSQAIRLVRQRADQYERDAQKSGTCYLDDAPPEALTDHADDDEDEANVEPTCQPCAVIRAVRELAVGDQPVLRLLELYERGFTRRRDARAVGMSPAVYRTARERLTEYGQRARADLAERKAHLEDDRHRNSRVVRNAMHQSTRVKQRSA
jgi:hypothetical protein